MGEEIKNENITNATAEVLAVDNNGAQRFEERPRKPLAKKRRVCPFCQNKVAYIDYKDANRLRKYVAENGKILPRRQTGLCAHHQREITNAVKRARNMSLM